MRNFCLFLLVLGLCLLPGHIFSAAGGGGAGGERDTDFLDLPGGIGYSEEEEKEPELIEFYNNQYEGDAFFFLCDRSGSMGDTVSSGKTKFAILKQEVIEAIQGLSKQSVTTVQFYDRTQQMITIGNPPIKMDQAGKARLIGRLAGLSNFHGSCMGRGADRLFPIANKTEDKAHRTMLLVGDGGTTCPVDTVNPDAIFQRIMALNRLNIPINTIYTGPMPQKKNAPVENPDHLRKISRATNGTFKVAAHN